MKADWKINCRSESEKSVGQQTTLRDLWDWPQQVILASWPAQPTGILRRPSSGAAKPVFEGQEAHKVCELASRTSLTPPIPGAKGGSTSQRRLPGQSYTSAPCQLRPCCSLRLTPIRGMSAAASPRPRSQCADGLRRGRRFSK
jgi:hypothetical protein